MIASVFATAANVVFIAGIIAVIWLAMEVLWSIIKSIIDAL